jgi:hypothetical protein
MEQRVSELIREMREMRRKIKGLEGKVYRIEEKKQGVCKKS